MASLPDARPGRRRWVVGGALAVITALSYLDRQTLPVVIGEIQRDIPISNVAFSELQALFLLAYAIMYAGGGWLVDRVGTRFGYALVAGVWSVACMLHAVSNSVLGLGTARFLLGLGEGGGFPASAKATAEWFPARERSMAVGLFNTGSAVGAVVAPPFIAVVVLHWHWRAVFVIAGAAGVLWALLWGWLYAPAATSTAIDDAERAYILGSKVEPARRVRWLDLLSIREVWTLIAVKFLTDGAWFFFIFWLPKYLGDARGFKMSALGSYAWIPYAFAGVGSFVGGWFSAWLMRRGYSLDASRKIALGVSAAMLPMSILVVSAPVHLALVFVSIAFLGHQFWSVIVQTLPADFFPAPQVGSVAGLIGCAGSFGAMLFNLLVGVLLDHFGSYAVPFLLAGLMHPLAFVIIMATLRVAPLRRLAV
jgi:ACS family hexuronate transporter-like MFS transporter